MITFLIVLFVLVVQGVMLVIIKHEWNLTVGSLWISVDAVLVENARLLAEYKADIKGKIVVSHAPISPPDLPAPTHKDVRPTPYRAPSSIPLIARREIEEFEDLLTRNGFDPSAHRLKTQPVPTSTDYNHDLEEPPAHEAL